MVGRARLCLSPAGPSSSLYPPRAGVAQPALGAPWLLPSLLPRPCAASAASLCSAMSCRGSPQLHNQWGRQRSRLSPPHPVTCESCRMLVCAAPTSLWEDAVGDVTRTCVAVPPSMAGIPQLPPTGNIPARPTPALAGRCHRLQHPVGSSKPGQAATLACPCSLVMAHGWWPHPPLTPKALQSWDQDCAARAHGGCQ